MHIMNSPLPLSPSDYPPFFSNPHTLALLHSPDYFPIASWPRLNKPSTGEDGFFSRTVATPDTISHLLTLRRRTIASPPVTTPWPAPTADPLTSLPSLDPPDIYTLWHLVPPGVAGHPSTAHGGIVAACLDEAMSLAVALRLPHPDPGHLLPGEVAVDGFTTPRRGLFTMQLDVRYKRPVRIPAVTIIRSKVVARSGRKFWTRAHVLQSDPENPDQLVVTTDAMGFWMHTAPNL
ncbi:HotDog domain-containing protein [Aspergillus ambiguus]|uniref:PaaI family thioesterase n=1 Tax=Aspergillus ambiguus TaxID=176160 RepID=UPI003CCD9DC5